jgi:D-proline reductase (dithiol) PrdB
VLAHVFEAHGLATVALPSVKAVAEQMRPPRALYCEFPLGRPLGKPNDVELQHDVLRRAFALLDAPSGPVLAEYPETISIADAAPMACSLPIRHDASLPPAVDEAGALRDAYDRTLAQRGTTSVGRAVDADGVPDVVATFLRIADGEPWKDAGLPGDPISCAHDVRSYYEEAALSLADAPPDPGAAEAWFYEVTAGGQALLAARRALKEQGAPGPFWLYMARATRN